MLCEHYRAALLDMNVLAAEVRETEQQKHVDQVRDDAKVTFLNQIREQIQNAAQLVIESLFYDAWNFEIFSDVWRRYDTIYYLQSIETVNRDSYFCKRSVVTNFDQ